MNRIIQFIKGKINSGEERSRLAKINVIGALLLKPINIIFTLLVVPITIDYLNPTQYGVWLTLSSIICWISYFDLGFTHGFKNRFTQALAENNTKLAREYVSTAYCVQLIIFTIALFIILILNCFINWDSLLNIRDVDNYTLRKCFSILAIVFCINMVFNTFTVMLNACQKQIISNYIYTVGQLFALLSVWILTKTTEGSLVNLSLVYTSLPCLIVLIFSFVYFRTKNYKDFSPSFKYVNFRLTKSIFGLGIKFFLIMLSMLFVFQMINIMISRITGPENVTIYNIAYKYFNVIGMVSYIIISPFWVSFTDAYTKKDFVWMEKILKKLEALWLLCIPIFCIMLLVSNFAYKMWIGETVNIPLSVSIAVSIYVLFYISGSLYMNLINGIGTVFVQLIIYIVFAILSLPAMHILGHYYGLCGIIIVPALTYLFQSIICRYQLKCILSGKAKGLWLK